jgi:choline dehydrogenase-like flavoprotein
MITPREGIFDAIVVGSRPGGAGVTRELRRAGCWTLLLEKGPAAPVQGTLAQFVRLAMMPRRSFHLTQEFLGLAHGIALSGGSLFNYATAVEPPYEMIDRCHIDLRGMLAELAH